MAIKKLYSSDSRRKTISKLNNNFLNITPDIILEISDDSPTENMNNIIWIDTSMDIITKEINTKTYADEYFASHPSINKNTFKYIGDDGKPTLEFKKMIYGDDYSPAFRYILHPKDEILTDFCKPIEKQSSLPNYDLTGINFKIGKITGSLDGLFKNSSRLGKIDISDWDTSGVTSLYESFYNCRSFTSLDLNKWNTSNVLSLESTFYGCNSLTHLDLSKWDTRKVTNMEYTFGNSRNLTSIDISNWDISNVTNTNCMFYYCSSLTTIKGVFDLRNCTSYSSMFYKCDNLTSVTISSLPKNIDIDTFCRVANIDKSKIDMV